MCYLYVINIKTHVMKKSFKFRNARISITTFGYGAYQVHGFGIIVHCDNAFVWDWCDDESDKTKNKLARRYAYDLLKRSI